MPLVIRLDPELEAGLRGLSAEEGVSQAEVVRRLVRERLSRRSKRKSAYQIAEALGVIGIDADRRRDVAAKHSKHLKEILRAKRSA